MRVGRHPERKQSYGEEGNINQPDIHIFNSSGSFWKDWFFFKIKVFFETCRFGFTFMPIDLGVSSFVRIF